MFNFNVLNFKTKLKNNKCNNVPKINILYYTKLVNIIYGKIIFLNK